MALKGKISIFKLLAIMKSFRIKKEDIYEKF